MNILNAEPASQDYLKSACTEQPRILVVEDDDLLRRTYEMLLRCEDFEVSCAENGAEGLRLFQEQPFDLILTDRNMPGMDGVGLIKAVRELSSHVPIIMISGSLSREPLEPDVAPEVCAALPKPVSAKEICAAIEFALNHGKQHRGSAVGAAPLLRFEARRAPNWAPAVAC